MKLSNDYINYINDILEISYTYKFIFNNKDINALSHIENYLDDKYINKIIEINKKYENTNNKELKLIIEGNNYSIENKLHLLLFSSYYNIIISFIYDNKFIYPKNIKYKKSREKDFNILIKTIIEKSYDSIKYNITYPKIIIKNFLKQIKNIKKYNYLYNHIKLNYYPHCRNEIGLCYLKNGKDIYRNIVRESIGYLNISPEEIHNIGLKLLKEPVKVKHNYYKNKKDFWIDCCKYADYIYDNIIDKYFHYKPKKRFILYPVLKKFENISSVAFYNNLEDKVYINLKYYKEINKDELYSLIMHECMHSYHFSFLKHYKISKYYIYGFNNNALIEGFAHYMEIYCDNYNDNNSMSILRKARLIVDTGINYYGWTYKQALQFLNKYLPNKKKENMNEIERYICMPGQSLGYLIGKLHIINIRDFFINSNLGSIKDFHHQLLIDGIVSFITINKKFNYNRIIL